MITDMKKTIKNPLKKRWMRELMGDKGKYLALFLFLTLTIGFVAGYLVADNSMIASYDESFEKYNVEDGHFSLAVKMPSSLKKNLEDEDVIITKQYYKDENISGSDITTNGKADPAGSKKTVRIFRIRDSVNRSCLMKGRMPEKKNEIVIDRLFSENNGIDVGDKMKVDGMNYEITGLVALPDYSALFKNNSDMMFNATKFTVALMNRAGFERIDDDNLVYQYAWTNNNGSGSDTDSVKKKNDKIEDILRARLVAFNILVRLRHHRVLNRSRFWEICVSAELKTLCRYIFKPSVEEDVSIDSGRFCSDIHRWHAIGSHNRGVFQRLTCFGQLRIAGQLAGHRKEVGTSAVIGTHLATAGQGFVIHLRVRAGNAHQPDRCAYYYI